MPDIPLIPGVRLLHPHVHHDERGSFLEIVRENELNDSFVQANHSRSRAGVLRGLHFHRYQADAWYVLSGHARVGLADLRLNNESIVVDTFDLRADDPSVLYIPPGVAHGFLAVTDLDLLYWVTQYYDASDEHSVAWNDPMLGIAWGIATPVLSERDRTAPRWDRERVARLLHAS